MKKKRKIKKKVRTKGSWITDIPIGVCIFFIVLGILIGNIFVIGTWYYGKIIDRSEAISVSADFNSYSIHTSSKGAVNEIEICFSDYENLYMEGVCFNAEIEDSLDKIQSGNRVDLLLHPNSGYVWEMRSEEETILSFDYSKSEMLKENILFSILGTFGYFCAVMGTASLLMQLIKRRKYKIDN